MRLKKTNAVLGLLLSAVCLTHVVAEVGNGITHGALQSQNQIIARICGTIAILHVLISCYMLFISHEGKHMNQYPRENASTLLQRIRGTSGFPLPLGTGTVRSGGRRDQRCAGS